MDAVEMKKTFEQFDYQIIQLQSKEATKPAIFNAVDQLSEYLKWDYKGDKYNPDNGIKTIVFAFCGHGTSHYRVRANDGRYFSLKDVVEPLANIGTVGDVSHDIPKLFLIDACRKGDDNPSMPAMNPDDIHGKFRMDYATIQGEESFDGLWMKKVAHQLRECDKTYQSVMGKVNKEVAEEFGQKPQILDQLNIDEFKLYYKKE